MRRSCSRTHRGRWLAAAAILLAVPACDLSTGTESPRLDGKWLTIEYTVEHAEAGDAVRLIPDRGGFRHLSLGRTNYVEDNQWSWTGGWNRRRGDWGANDTILAIAYQSGAGVEWRYRILPGDRLRLTRSQAEGYDFDDDGTRDPTIRTLELVRAEASPDPAILGVWSAGSYTFTSVAEPATTYDLVAEGGSYAITFSGIGTFRSTEERPGAEEETVRTGDFAALLGLVWLIRQSRVDLGRYTLEGNTLVITFQRAEWDFDGDGVADPATAEIRLTEAG